MYGGDWLDKNPFHRRGVIRFIPENNKRKRRVSEEAALLAACHREMEGNGGGAAYMFETEMMKLRIIAAMDTGMRQGEIQLLQLKYIDFKAGDHGVITVPGEISKFPEDRDIPMTPRFKAALQKRRFLAPEGFVFGNEIGGYVKDFRSAWEGILKRAGITDPAQGLDGDLHWHDCRHEFGSRMTERGVPLSVVKELMGHQSIVTTQRYDNQTMVSKQKAIRVLAWGGLWNA